MDASQIIIRSPRESEFSKVLQLRYQVLDEPVGLPKKGQPGKSDKAAQVIHRAAFDGTRLVSTVRLDLWKDDEYLVRRMATDPSYQRRGIGAKVLLAAEEQAIQNGIYKILLHARQGAVGFYRKLGYEPTGRTEIHDGDKNLEMVKTFAIEAKA